MGACGVYFVAVISDLAMYVFFVLVGHNGRSCLIYQE
jgi:hypothetical protein